MPLYRCSGGNRKITKINLGIKPMGIRTNGNHVLTWDVSSYKDYSKFTINNFCDSVPDTINLMYLGNGGQGTGTSMSNLSRSYDSTTGIYTVNYNINTAAGWNSEVTVHAELFIYS